MKRKLIALFALGVALTACRIVDDRGDDDGAPSSTSAAAEDSLSAAPLWRIGPPTTADELTTARRDTSWRVALDADSLPGTGAPAGSGDATEPGARPAGTDGAAAPGAPGSASVEAFEDIGTSADSTAGAGSGPPRLHLPVSGESEGPSALRAQVLLDLALFSPGVADGRWNANAERALYWFQRREGLPASGSLDAATLDRLWEAAGAPDTLIAVRTLTAEDVEGPFVDIPDDVYRKADLDCLCYESLEEKLAELAHSTPEVLRGLNPGRDLNRLAAGDSLRVPLLGSFAAPSVRADLDAPEGTGASGDRRVARLIISDRGRYLHGVDASGRVLFHLPATLGSDYFPSPTGSFEVRSVSRDPWFHYQPALLEGADPADPEARLAPGPNSPVGVAWIALSKEHYGIHGTAAPETIGFVTSSGCVRLTNWDARLVAAYVSAGTPVEFRDVDRAPAAGDREPGPGERDRG